ncbi:uncharacterized protein PG998_015128 [Apiospora kogelbergensis]|uniref:uncharacterized protein n=1 Tax=Apiospora kogelbergensis TaxID=1337665 RepID=UPI00312D1E59
MKPSDPVVLFRVGAPWLWFLGLYGWQPNAEDAVANVQVLELPDLLWVEGHQEMQHIFGVHAADPDMSQNKRRGFCVHLAANVQEGKLRVKTPLLILDVPTVVWVVAVEDEVAEQGYVDLVADLPRKAQESRV